MREIIRKLGRCNTVILITLFSILASSLLTYAIFYFKQDFTHLKLTMAVSMIVPLIVAPMASWPFVSLLMNMDKLEQEMRALATYDTLTGLLTRRAFFHDATYFIDYAEREQHPVTVIVLDLDSFKKINDQYGHLAGDEVLRHFGHSITAITRKSDVVGRIGGEEFAFVLPDTSQQAAIEFTEKLHAIVRASIIPHGQGAIRYTVSMGLISAIPNKTENIESLLKKADQSLYHAKNLGGNRTETFQQNTAE